MLVNIALCWAGSRMSVCACAAIPTDLMLEQGGSRACPSFADAWFGFQEARHAAAALDWEVWARYGSGTRLKGGRKSLNSNR